MTKEELLQKKLDIAVKALKEYEITETHDWIDSRIIAQKALKEIDLVGTYVSLAKEEV